MAEQKMAFQAEVSRLLHIVVNALYSEKQIFLRELISNASDACDRLRYQALTRPELIEGDPDLRVTIAVDAKARTLTIADNGIGMNREALVHDLGTIARSGTGAFLEELTGDARKDVALIGQFGVGFYSAFMVADEVSVLSRRAGEESAWLWRSDGAGSFTIDESERAGRGTTITLHLKKGEDEFVDSARIRHIVKTYSDHIALPIVLKDDKGEVAINAASAIWTRPKNEITAEQHEEFYHHVGHAFDKPWLTLHFKAEGKVEYTGLLYIPSSPPFDLFDPSRKHRVKLYVRRVFITEENEELVPPWLRFLRGVIDSEDLPLNVSREMLQQNPVIARIRAAVIKRVLSELTRKAEKAPEDYAAFWANFGAVLKEGIYEAPENRDALLKLARFRSTAGDGLVSLADYVGRMREGQSAIYTITGDSLEALRHSPQLEGFRARGVEVLLLTDPVDEFWLPAVGQFDDKPIVSATSASADLSAIPPGDGGETEATAAEEAAAGGRTDSLIALFKLTLGDAVKDVRTSARLTDSPVCLVADAGDLDMHLEKLLRQHRQLDHATKRVLEINPRHAVIRRLAEMVGSDGSGDRLADAAWLLLDQARILQGEALPDPAGFTRRLNGFIAIGLAA